MSRHTQSSDDLPSRLDGRLPPDLSAHESALAAWFGHLERPEPPADLRRAVLAAAPLRSRSSRPGWVRGFPLGAWGLASAALLLVALGLAVTVELTDPIAAPASHTAAGNAASSVHVVEDVTMPLFHEVETFDEVGLPRGELIADWGR